MTLQLATRLRHLPQAGTIVISAAVQRQAAGFFQFDDLGTHTLPGVTEPVHLYACSGVAPMVSRLEVALARRRTAFQGRTQEMALLEAA